MASGSSPTNGGGGKGSKIASNTRAASRGTSMLPFSPGGDSAPF